MMDLRLAVRQLARNPGFAATAILPLALGMAATTAILSIASATLFRQPAYADPGRLLWVMERELQGGWHRIPVAPSRYAAWVRDSRSFQGLAAARNQDFGLLLPDRPGSLPQQLSGGRISANLCAVLGVPPVLGRSFREEESTEGRDGVALISHELWTSRFEQDPGVLGRAILLNGRSHVVVGVMPEGFEFPPGAFRGHVWTPLVLTGGSAPDPQARSLAVLARLKPGVPKAAATVELNHLTDLQAWADGLKPGFLGVSTGPLNSWYGGSFRRQSGFLLGAAGVLMLLVTANVAGLLLTKFLGQSRELAVRSALGASRILIVRQCLVESVLISLAGGIAGLLLAPSCVRGLVALLPEGTHHIGSFTPDATTWVLGFGLVLIAAAGVGLLPALPASRPNLTAVLRDATSLAGTPSHVRLRSALVVGQVALTVVLVSATVVLLQSLAGWRSTRWGFRPAGLLTAELNPDPRRHADARAVDALHARLLERIRAIPGVQDAALATAMPLVSGDVGRPFEIEGVTSGPQDRTDFIEAEWVSPDYLRTLGIPIRRGRGFQPSDFGGSPRVAVVNEEFVRKHFPHRDPLGARIHLLPPKYLNAEGDQARVEVVGVIPDMKRVHPGEPPWPAITLPLTGQTARPLCLAVHTGAGPLPGAQILAQAVAEADPQLAVNQVRGMPQRVTASVAEDRLMAFLFQCFAALALLLSALGLYGVLALQVLRRTRELGVRMALGAARGSLLWLMLLGGMRLFLIGALTGGMATAVLGRLLAGWTSELRAPDAWTVVWIGVALTAPVVAACWIPARRVLSLDPMTALRG